MKKFSRKLNTRSIRNKITVICQGETEQSYFNSFDIKGKGISLEVILVAKDPSKILLRGEKEYHKTKKELKISPEVWLVFDKDNFDNFDTIINKAKQKNIYTAHSNISFEVWVYAHYEFSTAQDTVSEIIKKIKKYEPKYDKGKSFCFDNMRKKQKQAFANIKKINEFSNNKKPSLARPYSAVGKLVERIEES